MVSERGAANIRKFNADRERSNLVLVQEELRLCRKRKLQFRSIGLLAAHIADRTRIHRTTLIRNSRYKALLADYMRSQPGAATVVGDESDDPFVLKAKLALCQLETATLRGEVRHLSAQLSGTTKVASDAPPSRARDVEFSNAYVLLCLVLARAEAFAVDLKSRVIVDLAARPSEQIVGGPERSTGFISWLEFNNALPFAKAVKRIQT